ncbi:alpha/beta hydrolase [Candidatus Gottesmanbacteria bacterium]|nr:alpha/beta hydrolase [Candidatus Gottesmanbacteria bacterium]
MKPRIIYIHGNQTTHWSFGWSPWLKKELDKKGYKTFFETFPDSIIARAKYWLPFLKLHVKAGANDVIVGWSSGAVAALRYAETNKIRGSILIAPSHTDLNDELERQSGYFKKPWNWQKIKANQSHIALVYSENDPYIPQKQFQFIAEKLKPTIIKVPKAKHFIERNTFPEVLEYILQTY